VGWLEDDDDVPELLFLAAVDLALGEDGAAATFLGAGSFFFGAGAFFAGALPFGFSSGASSAEEAASSSPVSLAALELPSSSSSSSIDDSALSSSVLAAEVAVASLDSSDMSKLGAYNCKDDESEKSNSLKLKHDTRFHLLIKRREMTRHVVQLISLGANRKRELTAIGLNSRKD